MRVMGLDNLSAMEVRFNSRSLAYSRRSANLQVQPEGFIFFSGLYYHSIAKVIPLHATVRTKER